MVAPKMAQQTTASAHLQKAMSTQQKHIQFGDVIIRNPPKNFSLAEIVDRQELAVG
jgi:hypothetical protein